MRIILNKTRFRLDQKLLRKIITDYYLAILGFTLIYYGNLIAGIRPFLICGSLILLMSLISPENCSSIYLSSCFAGFIESNQHINFFFILLCGFFIVKIYKYFPDNYFQNIGGRAGLISFISHLIVLSFLSLLNYSGILQLQFDLPSIFIQKKNSDFMKLNNIMLPIISSFSCCLVYLLSEHRNDIIKITNRTFAYGLITILGALFLINSSKLESGEYYYSFWNIGCVAGLTVKSKFLNSAKEKDNYFHHYLIVGYFSGIVSFLISGFFMAGGKHGVYSLIGNLIYLNLRDFCNNKMTSSDDKSKSKKE